MVADLMPAPSPSDLLQKIHLVAVLLGPAGVHAKQDAGPILALGAAGTGVDFEIGLVGVGLARQQRFEFAPRGLGLERLQHRLGLGDDALILSASPSSIMVIWSARSRSIRPMALSWSSSALRSCITRWARAVVIPQRRIFGLRVELARRALALSKSKMPPQQSNRPPDVFDQLFGFGAHV